MTNKKKAFAKNVRKHSEKYNFPLQTPKQKNDKPKKK